MTNGTAGRKAEPNCKRQEMVPTSLKARFAHVPRNTPNVVHSCQDMTNPPRIGVGIVSAQKTGITEAFMPIPIPRRNRVNKSSHQFCDTAEPITDKQHNIAEIKMAPRLPRK